MLFQTLQQKSVQVILAFILTTVSHAGLVQSVAATVEIISSRDALTIKENEREIRAQVGEFSLEKVGSFPGEFQSFSPDGQRIVTYISESDRTLIFDINGTELASFSDTNIRFAPSGQIMALVSPRTFRSSSNLEYTTRLMTIDGAEIANLQGARPTFVFNEQRLTTYDQLEDISYLFDFEGEKIATLKGWFFGLTLGPQDLVTYSDTEAKYYLYNFDGVELASFPGSIEGWQPFADGQRVLVSDDTQARLFDRDGVEQATYVGYGISTPPDGQAVVIYSEDENISRLLTLDGEEIASYVGPA